MHKILTMLTILLALIAGRAVYAAEGLIAVKSSHSVETTADNLVAVLEGKGMTVFTQINHSQGAASVDMELPATVLVIFGNPKVGTALMHCNRSVAIDLPQKALIWRDDSGDVWLGYNDPEYLSTRHNLDECAEVTEKVKGALSNFAKAATE